MASSQKDVAVLGGSVSGLAAATKFQDIEDINKIKVFERQEYDEKRVDCGEAINDTTLIPLEKTAENGFLNDVEGFQLRVHSGTDRSPRESPVGVSLLECPEGYICDRDTVEQTWAKSLSQSGIIFETGASVTKSQYFDIIEDYEYVIDATGQPSLSHKIRGSTQEYVGDMVALNATVEGDFSDYVKTPRIFFEGYVGYSWSFPKSETAANVGIGWAGDERPDDYMEAIKEAARRNHFPVPSREQVNIYTIPRGPSLDPEQTHFPEEKVFLVGDAAGIANRYQGEGICQGIRSAYLLVDLIAQDRVAEYPRRLYEQMKAEYRLAHLMRGAWVEHKDPELLAAVAESLEGLSVDDITRHPHRVITRVAQNPLIATQLIADSGMIRRFINAYSDSWEYNSTQSA